MRALLRVSASHARRHLLQTLLMVLGIAVGVAVVVAIDLATSSARQSFADASVSLTGRATHAIVGQGADGPSVALYRHLRVERGLRHLAPIIEGYVTLPPHLGNRPALPSKGTNRPALPPQASPEGQVRGGRPLQVFGVDPFAESPFRDWLEVASSPAGQGARPGSDLGAFFTCPRGVLAGAPLAQREGWKVGSRFDVRVGGQVRELRVVGLLQPSSPVAEHALESTLVCDLASAQEILGTGEHLTRIDAVLASQAEVQTLQAALPGEVRLAAASERHAAMQQMTAAFELNLTAISLLTLVIGVFLIYNTVTFFVVSRRSVFGVLRSLGATREEIFGLVVLEASLLGLAGSLAGLVLGTLLGRAALVLVTRTINDLYYTLPSSTFVVGLGGLTKGLVLGVLASALAALAPAAEAAAVQPVGALRSSTLETRAGRLVWVLAGMSALALVGAAACLGFSDSLAAGFVGLVLLLIGSAGVAPALTVVLMGLIEPLSRRTLGVLGRLAPRTLVRSLSRTGVAVAALMLAVSAIVGVQIMVGSFRITFVEWLDATLGADIYLSSPDSTLSRADGFDASLVQRVAAVEGVQRVASESHFTLDTPLYGRIHVVGVSSDIARQRRFVWRAQAPAPASSPEEAPWQAPSGEPGSASQAAPGSHPLAQPGSNKHEAPTVLISQPLAFRHHLHGQPGLTVVLPTDHGEQRYTVAGIYYDYGSERGTVLMDARTYAAAYPRRPITAVAAFVAPGQEVDGVCQRVRAAVEATHELAVFSNRALRSNALDVFERTFAITSALRVLVGVVAFLGVLSSLLALQLERQVEMAILRSLGMTSRQIGQLVLTETLLLSGAAGVLALPCGTALAAVLVYVINPRSFGWTLAFVPQAAYYGEALLLALVAGLLAGVYPAWRCVQAGAPRSLQVD